MEAALADDPATGDRLDRVLGLQHALSFLGDMAGPVLLGLGATTGLGWRGAFLVTAALLGCYTLVLAETRFPAPTAPSESAHGAWLELRDAARYRSVWRLAAADLLLNPLDEPLLALAVARAAQRTGADGLEQLLAGGLLVGGVAGSLLVARRGLTVGAVGPFALAGGVVGVAAAPALPVAIGAMGLIGLGMGLTWAELHHRELTVLPGRVGAVSAIVSVATVPGMFVPAAAGALADRVGLTAALWAYVPLALALLPLRSRVERTAPGTASNRCGIDTEPADDR